MSEIDNIFAKAKDTSQDLSLSTQSHVNNGKSRNKKKQKKTNRAVDEPPDGQPSPINSSTKRSPPEIVVDPSQQPNTKRHKSDRAPSGNAKHVSGKARKTAVGDGDSFQDSRGTGNRRRTEEGWAIYKEDELRIGNEEGDTPLCPFDCECCF